MIAVFEQDGLRIRVTAPVDDLDWLHAYLVPDYAPDAGGDAAAMVTFEEGQVDVEREMDEDEPTIDAFSLDTGPLRLPVRVEGDTMVLTDRKARIRFHVSAGGRAVRVVHDDCRLHARVRLLRVVREYAHNHSIRTGGLVLHAAGVAVDGSVLAIAGPKGAGKTTLALRLLSLPDAAYLANDRLLIRHAIGSEPGVEARGVPTIVAIRPGSRAVLPDVAVRLAACGDFREAGVRGAAGAAMPREHDAPWQFTPNQIAAAVDRPRRGVSRLGAVLFVSPERTATAVLRSLALGDAREAMASAVLGVSHGPQATAVFVATAGPAPTGADLRLRAQALSAHVPCLSLSVADGAGTSELQEIAARCLARHND